MLLSVYITSFSADSGYVSLSLEDKNMQTVASNCNLSRLNLEYVDKNLSIKLTASPNTSSSHRCSSHT